MSLLSRLLPTNDQVQAVADFEASCKALRDATRPLDQVSPAEHLWLNWWQNAEKVRETGLDPLDYANSRRGVTRR